MGLNRKALLVLFLAAGSQGGAQTITPAQLSRPIEFWNPDFSPDGKLVVFESTLDGATAIYSIGADGSGLRRLTSDTSGSSQPHWSPDGKRIVFSSNRSGSSEIYSMAADGSDAAKLTSMGAGSWYRSSYSPDGKWIAFQGRFNTREVNDRVYVLRSDGTGLRVLSDTTAAAEGPQWSRDGRSVEYSQISYPRRLWSEMGPDLMKIAQTSRRWVSMPLTGGNAVVAKPPTRTGIGTVVPDDAAASPNGQMRAYTKNADGWWSLMGYDVATKKERLLVGGPAAGPLGYLRSTTLTSMTDTLDTYESPRTGGAATRGAGAVVVRRIQPISGGRWELVDTWLDSSGVQTARQATRTAPRSLATELEYTRATADSASMSYAKDRSTGWVVAAGRAAQLVDGASTGDRYAGVVVLAAIAKSKPAIGAVFIATSGSLYGGNPLATRVDSVRVVRRDSLRSGSTRIPTLVVARGTSEFWLDETTGAAVASKGSAGPQRFWWHVRRGVAVPVSPEGPTPPPSP